MTPPRNSATDLANRSMRASRRRDAALLLPILGVVLYTTPILRIFTADLSIFGIPLVFLFVYGAWAALILLGRKLAQRLRDQTDP